MTLPAHLKERVHRSVASVRSPTRESSRALTVRVLVASVGIATLLFFAADGRAHGAGRPMRTTLVSTGGWALLALLAAWGAYRRGRSATGPSRAWLLAVAVGTPPALYALMLTIDLPSSIAVHPIRPERVGIECFSLTVAAAAFPLVSILTLRRGSDPVHPAAAAAAIAVASGAAAGVMVEAWCPISTWQHVGAGHILPIVALGVLGAAVGGQVLRLRWRAQAAEPASPH